MAIEQKVIKIDASLWKRLEEYRNTTGIPITRSANEAILDYLEVVVPARLEVLGYSQNDKKSTHLRKAS